MKNGLNKEISARMVDGFISKTQKRVLIQEFLREEFENDFRKEFGTEAHPGWIDERVHAAMTSSNFLAKSKK